MPDIILFGATGYTGRLTARALADRGLDIGLAGRDGTKLEELSKAVGRPPTFLAEAGDTVSLVRALEDAKVLITCVGPFTRFGRTAADAAILAGVHYIDSTGEGPFVEWLIREKHDAATAAGVAMAPAMGFDEVPADVAATLAAEGIPGASLTLTYALPRKGSMGTRRSALGILASKAPWLEGGEPRPVGAGDEERWAPLPHPLGPRLSVSFPFAICHLAPRHLDLTTFETYVVTSGPERVAMRTGAPLLRKLLHSKVSTLAEKVVGRGDDGPTDEERLTSRWTLLAEALGPEGWRNVVLTGIDVYGLTADLLATAACEMATDGYDRSGVLAPVEAVGLEVLEQELRRRGTHIDQYSPA